MFYVSPGFKVIRVHERPEARAKHTTFSKRQKIAALIFIILTDVTHRSSNFLEIARAAVLARSKCYGILATK